MTGSANKSSALSEVAWVFLKLGTVAFGGPAAHIAMMDEEVVRRRRWLTEQEFLDYLSATNFIPGPNSTEMAIHIGYRRAGWAGLLTAGSCFIGPAALIVTAIAWAYVRFGRLPEAQGLLYCIKPTVIAIILQALWKLGRSAVKTKVLGLIAAVAIVLCAAGVNELLVLLIGGLLSLSFDKISGENGKRKLTSLLSGLTLTAGSAPGGAITFASAGLWPMFLVFAKIGTVLFGSGYVLLAFLRTDLVERYHWLTQQQLLDAVAVGQITPGPLFTTATFIGYLLHGRSGAIVATLGIFLPAFFFVALSAQFLGKLRASITAAKILDGINVASLALMVVVTWQLARAAIIDSLTLALLVATSWILYKFRDLNSAWLVVGAAFIGLMKTKFF